MVLAERNQLKLENDHLTKIILNLQEENRKLHSSVKSSKKKLSLTDSTFGVANLCKYFPIINHV